MQAIIYFGSRLISTAALVTAAFLITLNTAHASDTPQSVEVPDYGEVILDPMLRLDSAETDYERWVAVGDAGNASVDNNLLDKAAEFANEALSGAAKYQHDWNYGNAIHKGNLVLGRVALRNNDTDEAKRRLKLAGQTPGSPQLDSFGPNMILAKELLQVGETDAVLEYFKLCEKFWDLDNGSLQRWTAQVLQGEIPDFGANLSY